MKCSKCGQDNIAGSKFCSHCGNKLERACPKCHRSIAEDSRFCPHCGTNLVEEPAAILNMEDNVIAGDVTNIVNIYQGDDHSKTDLRCHECGEFIPAAHQQTSTCYRCGHHFCSKHLSGNFCASCSAEEQLHMFEFIKLDNRKYAITKLKNPRTLKTVIPSFVESIEDGAFMDADVIEVSLPDGLLKIGARAFKNCNDLTKINFPKSLMVIGDEAFLGCHSLAVFPPKGVRIGQGAWADTLHEKEITPPIRKEPVSTIFAKSSSATVDNRTNTSSPSEEEENPFDQVFHQLFHGDKSAASEQKENPTAQVFHQSSSGDTRTLILQHSATAGAAQELWISVDNSKIYKIWTGNHLALQVKGEDHTIQTHNPLKRNTYRIKVPEKGLRFTIFGKAFTNEIKTEPLEQ